MSEVIKQNSTKEQQTKKCECHRTVPVADIFYSIQGEGFNVGIPSVFIRFAGCNLKCPWCDSWWAVTKQVLMAQYDDTYERAKMVMKYMLHKGGIYDTGKVNVVFTGGEPTLYQNFISNMIKSLPEIYSELNHDLPEWIENEEYFLHSITFEMETNGLIYPEQIIETLINPIIRIKPIDIPRFVFEISPKLTDNIMTDKMYRKVVENIMRFKELDNETKSNVSFICKFVTDGSSKEVDIIEQFIMDTQLSRRKVYLMPKVSLDDRENYTYVARTVANVCMMKYWRFSPREQVILFEKYRSA
jgi:organic radical activating enzyme